MANEFVDPSTALGLRDVPDETVNIHAGLDVQPLIEAVLLLDHADLRTDFPTLCPQVVPKHGRPTRRRREERREHLDRRRLPRSAPAEGAEHLGARDVAPYTNH